MPVSYTHLDVYKRQAYVITLVSKIMCYAIVAVAMDLIWGYTGILSLGHGLFFALGGYAFGMYLMRQIGRDGSYKADLPDFMVFLDWKELPWYWTGSDHFLWALFLAVSYTHLESGNPEAYFWIPGQARNDGSRVCLLRLP